MVAPATYNRKLDAQVEDNGDFYFVGVNNRLAADKLPAGMLYDAENLRLRDGNAGTRLGVVKPGWLNATTSGSNKISPPGPFYGAGVFKDPDSFEWVLEAVGGDVFRHKANNFRQQLKLPTGVKVFTRSQFVQAFNRVFCFRGRHVAPLVMTDVDIGFVDVVARWSAATVYNAAIVATGQVADEIAYGPFQAVTSITSIALTATVTTTNEHGYITGADVTITGASPSTYNGRFNITVIDSTTFTYQLPNSDTTPATGTIKASNMAYYYKALGSRVTLTSLTHSTTTATATKNGHGFTNGQYVTIAGASPAGYNGTFVISGVAANTFQYTLASDPGADATGTITARTSVVLAAQSPDTNPEAWQQIFNVLPNADDALYVNNQLLVPTAYTPGTNSYDSTSSYTKTDYLVAMNYLDAVHFNFVNDFRINQGSDDEIVCLVKYAADTAIVFKTKSFAVVSNITLDLTQLTVDIHTGYGATGARAAVTAGKNVLFASPKRGVCGLVQNLQGQIRSVDIPFSNDVPKIVNRINWNAGDQIRTAWWDDKLYVAVPLNGSQPVLGDDMLATSVPLFAPNVRYITGFTVGQQYRLTGPATDFIFTTLAYQIGVGWTYLAPTFTGDFTARATAYYLYSPDYTQDSVRPMSPGLNNAMLVYDFRAGKVSVDQPDTPFMTDSGQWCGLDTGGAICPMEFFKATYNGLERLFYIGADNFVSLVEEAFEGDQIKDDTTVNGLTFQAIADKRVTRGYRFGTEGLKAFKAVQVVGESWNPQFTVTRNTGAAYTDATVLANQTFSRTKYLRPFDRADFVATNANLDFASSGRGDYSVPMGAGGFYLDGCAAETFQEFYLRRALPNLAGRFVQFTITNDSGRLNLKSITPTTMEGQRRAGIQI